MPDNNENNTPPVTVGVITLERRKAAFVGEADTKPQIEDTLAKHLSTFNGAVRVINSPENNIAIGRNVVLDNAAFDLIAFLDDDEYPSVNWLNEMMDVHNECDSVVVAGPVLPVFEDACPAWVKTTDLHNVRNRQNKGIIEMTGTGNVLIQCTGPPRLWFMRISPPIGHKPLIC